MKKSLLRLVGGLLLLAIAGVLVFGRGSAPAYQVAEEDVKNAFDLLNDSLVRKKNTYFDFVNTSKTQIGTQDYKGELVEGNLVNDSTYTGNVASIGRDEVVTYKINVTTAGLYELHLDYKMKDKGLINPTISVLVNGQTQFDEAKTIDVPLHWKDSSKEFTVDSYGDESLPQQERIDEWTMMPMYNKTYYTVDPLMFELQAGENIIEISNTTSDEVLVGMIAAKAPKQYENYEDYVAKLPVVETEATQLFVNATDYVEKNSSYVRLNSLNNPAATPYDPVYKKLNVIDGNSWKTPGQEITYNVSVENDGWYELSFHYLNEKNDFSVFRSMAIDGEIPFEEMRNYEFEVTKPGKWENETLGNEDGAYKFYLTKGDHTLSLRAEYETVSEEIRNLQLVNDHINQFALDIIKVAGKDIDKNRTWKLTKFLPETEAYLMAYQTIIKSVIQNTAEYAPNGQQSSTLSFLNKAIVQLDKMIEKPDELPLYLEDLYSGSGSVSQMIGDTMATYTDQPLFINGFYVTNNESLPKPNASMFVKLSNDLKSFAATFTTKKYVVTDDSEAVNIWVNRPITHIDTMQKLADAQFTPKTGIKVKISAMPDVNKLILANAANTSPDVALGLTSYMPFDLAIRGALYDLTTFDDFWDVASDFAPGAMIPYVLNDGVYAIPETLEFQAIIYRKDIMESLDIDVPSTWDDVVDILPVLQRYGMNFYHPTAGGTSLKWFYQTSPLIYQNGGVLYSEDGISTTIDSPEAVKGLSKLTELFRTYALPAQVANFYNSFRYATLPIGITQFGEYLQIKNAAPELVGQWELAPYPGTEQADGSIDRWFISNGVGGSIFKDSEKVEESWEFLKWWMSEEVQTTYSYNLQSTFGPEYVWLSANLDAVKNSPIEGKDKDVIVESAQWLRDVPRTPGQYMLERGLSDIWNKAVFDGVSTRVSIDRQVVTINREIKKKMIEFGFLDEEGNVIKEYIVRDIDWIKDQIEAHTTGR